MHQCLELLTKALVLNFDSEINVKKFSHDILSLMEKCKSSIPVFRKIIADEQKSNLIRELKNSYLGLKYMESHSNFDFDAFSLFDEIANELKDAFVY